mmetsp:Transcript_38266/g.96270  ORF Transcript_38266/g.96270 Transcript_38266/m.96270 type:complete len:617 (+) Transcript_38266:160-2010(+)|eukprot:CAMPEP_0177645612 /NCGR_PEP_ID=MMETSP0447-20121125/9341_1 /TAXON_ID=0 /ORGANISM="Stygamoeba regulata, Strain BSH-02190019" /LENGTH=616 /DNA_ID=CAMNT_0019148105 /DNA_START=129 /DNA_END=1979 /DNA_ORIENTATION=+
MSGLETKKGTVFDTISRQYGSERAQALLLELVNKDPEVAKTLLSMSTSEYCSSPMGLARQGNSLPVGVKRALVLSTENAEVLVGERALGIHHSTEGLKNVKDLGIFNSLLEATNDENGKIEIGKFADEILKVLGHLNVTEAQKGEHHAGVDKVNRKEKQLRERVMSMLTEYDQLVTGNKKNYLNKGDGFIDRKEAMLIVRHMLLANIRALGEYQQAQFAKDHDGAHLRQMHQILTFPLGREIKEIVSTNLDDKIEVKGIKGHRVAYKFRGADGKCEHVLAMVVVMNEMEPLLKLIGGHDPSKNPPFDSKATSHPDAVKWQTETAGLGVWAVYTKKDFVDLPIAKLTVVKVGASHIFGPSYHYSGAAQVAALCMFVGTVVKPDLAVSMGTCGGFIGDELEEMTHRNWLTHYKAALTNGLGVGSVVLGDGAVYMDRERNSGAKKFMWGILGGLTFPLNPEACIAKNATMQQQLAALKDNNAFAPYFAKMKDFNTQTAKVLVVEGTVGSQMGYTVTETQNEVMKTAGALVLDMEAAAISQILMQTKTNLVLLKVISNGIYPEDAIWQEEEYLDNRDWVSCAASQYLLNMLNYVADKTVEKVRAPCRYKGDYPIVDADAL